MPKTKVRGGTVYVLEQAQAGTVMEVGRLGDAPNARHEVVLALSNGPLRLSGLTMEEARACGAILYRPVVVQITVKADDGIIDLRSHQKKGG